MTGWTLQSLIDHGMHIEAYCESASCHHHSSLDLQKLRDRLGPDAPAMSDDLEPKLRCTRCRGRSIGLIYSPDTKKVQGMWDADAYRKAKGR